VLTIAEYKNEKQVESYFDEHLSSGEYHTENGKHLGQWVGKTTVELGLKEGAVIKESEFKNLVQGVNPKTGKSFLIRKKSNRVIAREMLFSAPKTVSIMAITMGDDRLREAHEHAVREAFKEMEKLSQTRVRRGHWINHDEKRTTGNMVAARFVHETSRELDPQLHSHHVVINVTYDQVEDRLKALDPHFIYNSSRFVSEIYRSVLAQEVARLGYEIEKGRHTWRIKGISPEIETLFSKRAGQIEKAATRLLNEKGVELDTRGRALIAGITRRAKDHDIHAEEFLKYQLEQLSKSEQSELRKLIQESKTSKEKGRVKEFDSKLMARESVEYALKHIFERASVVQKNNLIEEALKHAQGGALISDIRAELESDKFLHRGEWVMTREERNREIEILSFIRDGKRNFSAIVESIPRLSSTLDDEQKVAVEKIASSLDRYIFMRGVAGAGKTFTLTELSRVAGSMKQLYLAPTGSATDTLRLEGFKNAKTFQLFMMSPEIQDYARNSLIVVDEAGLLSTKQVHSFLKKVREINARVVFVGDTLQHNSVEGGDALRLIEDYSVIEKVELSRIRRQKTDQYREAIRHLAKGDVTKGWDVLEKLNVIHEHKDDVRFTMIAKEYAANLASGVRPLVVCPTNDEITKLTSAIRSELRASGILSQNEVELDVYKSMNFTSVEKQYLRNYSAGMLVSFHKDHGKFNQGEVWKVSINRDGDIKLKHPSLGERNFDPNKSFESFDVVTAEKKSFSQGDRILMKANYATGPENKLPNGAVVEIAKIENNGRIILKNGKTLEKDFRHFTHGYALTSQASQGKTADRVIVSAGSRSGLALSKNQFYVSCSRGKEGISVYTEDKSRLREAVIRSSSRKLVLEELVRDRIVAKKILDARTSVSRSVEKSKDLIEKAFVKWNSKFKSKDSRNIEKRVFKPIIKGVQNERDKYRGK